MGIFEFGRWLNSYIKTKKPGNNIIINDIRSLGPISKLALDLPGVFHDSAAKTYKYGDYADKKEQERLKQRDPISLEADLRHTIKDKMTEIVSKFRPKDQLIIEADGVAPLAKITQQRSRRYKASLGRDPENPPLFDSNQITPGTRLMQEINFSIYDWIANNRDLFPSTSGKISYSNLIYSSHLTRGEGEHKLFKRIRDKQMPFLGAPTIFYGADGDLIMLSLASDLPQIYLSRESYEELINIDALRAELVSDLTMGRHYKADQKCLIQDFILMVYLMGNDFLPCVSAFSDIAYDIGLMILCYTQYMGENKGTITDANGNISWSKFSLFLSKITKYEVDLLEKSAGTPSIVKSRIFDQTTKKVPKMENGKPVEASVKTNEKDYNGKIFSKWVKMPVYSATIDFKSFREEWYDNALNPRSDEGNALLELLEIPNFSEMDITNMTFEYLKGLQWMLLYYTKGHEAISNKYFYRYNYAPLLSDIAKAAGEVGEYSLVEEVTFKESDPIFNPIHQLLVTLPPSSFEFIPEAYIDLVYPLTEGAQVAQSEGILSDLCPLSFDIDMDGKDLEHEGVALLPFVDPHRVINAVYAVDNGNTPEEYTELDVVEIKIAALKNNFQPRGGKMPREHGGRGRGRGGSHHNGNNDTREQKQNNDYNHNRTSDSAHDYRDNGNNRGRGRGRGRGGSDNRGRGRGGNRNKGPAWSPDLLM